jgi:hypothetical protein
VHFAASHQTRLSAKALGFRRSSSLPLENDVTIIPLFRAKVKWFFKILFNFSFNVVYSRLYLTQIKSISCKRASE